MNRLLISFFAGCILGWSGALDATSAAVRTIYISQQAGVDSNNDGSDINHPVKTLARARVLALTYWRNSDSLKILLKAGERFDSLLPMTNTILKNYDPQRNTFAFVWDIDRPLLISTYGGKERALLYGGKYTHEGGPQAALAVTSPSRQAVVIQNLHFKRWQVCGLFTYETQNVSFINNVVEEIGTLYFPDEKTPDIYGAGAIYPKNSSQVLIKGNYVRNIHNQFDRLDEMHVFYFTRLSQAEVSDNIIINASGPPLKFRRSQTQDIYVHDNAFYYTGPAQSLNRVQEGWVRYSGDAEEGCPSALFIERNKFYYPYCWQDRETCQSAVASRCSISNPGVCGADACDKEERIRWLDNDFRYTWQTMEVPDLPTAVPGSAATQPVTPELVQNSPNPFAEATSIRYHLLSRSDVYMAVYDLLGREIAVLVNQAQPAGQHAVTWNVHSGRSAALPNGVYFCRLRVDGREQVIKMVLNKSDARPRQ
jgi:hypothetical protein